MPFGIGSALIGIAKEARTAKLARPMVKKPTLLGQIKPSIKK